MPILSFDIGSINLACCFALFYRDENKYDIRKWLVHDINLCYNHSISLVEKNGKIICNSCEKDKEDKKDKEPVCVVK